jgi:Tol biopolymer transport system component
LGNVANPGGVELRTVEFDSGNEKIWLTSDSGFHYSWSPDSKFLLVSDWFLAPYDLFINLSSGNAWAVKVPPEIIGPSFDSWSRDGMHLYYSRRNDHYDGVEMVKLKLDFTDIQHLVDIPDGMEIIISPNEKLVAYTKSATPGIFTLNVDTNLERRIMKTNKITDSIFWSPDNQWTGTKLSTNFQGSDKYFAYNINTGKRKTLPIYYYTSGVQWWAPQTESPPDCEKIVNETLGPGKKLDDLLQDLQKEEK